MSVFGIDIGNYASRIGSARAGGVDILTNEYSDRSTLTYVAITARERLFGHAARQQQPTNMKSTYFYFKRMLGRRFSDLSADELSYADFDVVRDAETDEIRLKADYCGESRSFTVEQVYAMMLSRLAKVGGNEVSDCVLSMPVFATDVERRALLHAAHIANLNPLRILSDTTATALCYGLYHQDLPANDEPPRLVAFVDIGYTSVQCSVAAFNRARLKILGVSYDANVGGRNFDRLIMNTLRDEIMKSDAGSVDIAKTNKRGWLRLSQAAEPCKKMMSTISTPVPIDVECLINDCDYHSEMSRAKFEELSAHLLAKIRVAMETVLKNADVEKVHSVEIVGGSTRIPAIKALIKSVFGVDASTTLNADEAVARGCTLMCAILSPNFKVREYKIEDCQPFPITLSWKGSSDDEDTQVEVFNLKSTIPMSKMLSFYKKEPLVLEARYSYPNDVPIGDARIALFRIDDIVPDKNGNPSKVRVKVRLNRNGILEINQAFLVETVEENVSSDAAAPPTPAVPPTDNGDEVEAAAPATAKCKVKTLPLNVTAKYSHEMTSEAFMLLAEQEAEMQAMDKKQKERADAQNSLEEYIYEMRDKVSDDSSLYSNFVKTDDKTKLLKLLTDTENWLVEDEQCETCEKSVFANKLAALKKIGDPIVVRYNEFAHRSGAFEQLGRQCQQYEKAFNGWATKTNPDLEHLAEADMKKVKLSVEQKLSWLFQKQADAQAIKPFNDCPVTVAMIRQQISELQAICDPILRRPKPPPPPVPSTSEKNSSVSHANEDHPASNDNQAAGDSKNFDQMDVD